MVSRKQLLKIERRLDKQKDLEIKDAVDRMKREFDVKLVEMQNKCDESILEIKSANDDERK